MSKLATSPQALDTAKAFHEAAVSVGTYLLDNFQTLTPAKRQELQRLQEELLNYSSRFVTKAVSDILENMQAELAAIIDATQQATRVVQTIQNVKDVINAAAALTELGIAILSKDPVLIVKKVVEATDVAKTIFGK